MSLNMDHTITEDTIPRVGVDKREQSQMHPPRLSSSLHTSHYYLILIYPNIYLNSSSPITIP
jgi:hypothetical protein